MLVEVFELLVGALLDLAHDLGHLLRHEIYANCEESFLAVLDAMLL